MALRLCIGAVEEQLQTTPEARKEAVAYARAPWMEDENFTLSKQASAELIS